MPVPNPTIVDARDLLMGEGITLPTLPQLEPNSERITVVLLQPHGKVADSNSGVRNMDHALAIRKARRFLDVAPDGHLCVAPEYSCPWEIIDQITQGQIQVPDGAIWILGCEGISPPDLRQREANAPPGVKWIFEPPEKNIEPGQAFLDSVCIITRGTYQASSEPVLVVIVQFKTEPMGGVAYEQNGMIRGSRIYELRNPTDYSIRLVTLLCSDVLQHAAPKFEKLREYFFQQHRIFLIHLQLNEKPRHDIYKPYRDSVLLPSENRQILALNWARDVEVHDVDHGGAVSAWDNPAMSAVYSRRWKKLALQEKGIDECERRGLYFCFCTHLKSAVAIFNFREYVFVIRLSKVCQEAAEAHHRTYVPPEVVDTRKWDTATHSWVAETIPLDAETQGEIQGAQLNLAPFGNLFVRPRLFERFAALSLGELGLRDAVRASLWPQIDGVDATSIDQSEVIKRTTFAQDRDNTARQFRRERYLNLQRFSDILQANLFPRRMSPFTNATVAFEFDLPYSNVRAQDGRPGTGVYLHVGADDDARMLHTRILNHLRAEPTDRVDSDHVVIWYLGPMAPNGPKVLQYPPDSVPHTTNHPRPSPNSITNTNG